MIQKAEFDKKHFIVTVQ